MNTFAITLWKEMHGQGERSIFKLPKFIKHVVLLQNASRFVSGQSRAIAHVLFEHSVEL